MATEKHRFRRWFQIRLRSVLIVFALLCIGLAWIASERRHSARQMEIVEQLRPYEFDFRFGGKYDTLDRFYNKEPQGWWRNTARSLLGDRVIVANCYKYTFTDASMLSELTDLQELGLGGTEVSDIRPLSGLRELTVLDLGDTGVVDISPLATLTRLECLVLANTQVSDLSPLAGLKRLDSLWLYECRVTDLSPLFGLKNLTILEIGDDLQVSNEQVRGLLQALPNCSVSEFGFERTLDNTP